MCVDVDTLMINDGRDIPSHVFMPKRNDKAGTQYQKRDFNRWKSQQHGSEYKMQHAHISISKKQEPHQADAHQHLIRDHESQQANPENVWLPRGNHIVIQRNMQHFRADGYSKFHAFIASVKARRLKNFVYLGDRNANGKGCAHLWTSGMCEKLS